MNKTVLFASLVLLVLGCVASKPIVGLEVIFYTKGCTAFDNSTVDVSIIPEGLSVISSTVNDKQCYKLTKAEVSRKDLNISVYLTFDELEGDCDPCKAVHTLVYKITGEGLNATGVRVDEYSYFESAEFRQTFNS